MMELKPCPFCGKQPVVFLSVFSESYRIRCDGKSGCGVETAPYGAKEKAIKAWNKRTDLVPLEVWKQTAWERDIAIGQLEEHGITFGCIAPDVLEVVRCKDCKYWDKATIRKGFLICPASGMEIMAEDYCSYGKRKENT